MNNQELTINKKADQGASSSKNIVFDYYKLSDEIKALGCENKLTDFKRPLVISIISIVVMLLAIVSLYVTPILGVDFNTQVIVCLIGIAIGVGILLFSVHESRHECYEKKRLENSDRRRRIVEYMIRYYLVHNKQLDAKKTKEILDSGLDKVLKELDDKKISSLNCKNEVKHLSDKFYREWNEKMEKTKKSTILLFAVSIATAGIAICRDFSKALYEQSVLCDEISAGADYASSIGNLIAFVVLCFVVLLYDNCSDFLKNKYRDDVRNLEYAYYELLRIIDLM